jgi:hypothetical protein
MRIRAVVLLVVGAIALSPAFAMPVSGRSVSGATAAGAAITAQATSERLRVLFPRAELMLRTGDVAGAIAVLDRLIGLAEDTDALRSDADHLLLRRAYLLRAELRWEEGERGAVDADLDRVIELDPSYEMAEGAVPSALRSRFRGRRERKVGFLRVGRFPANARIALNGRALDEVPDLLPVLAGDYVVTGSLPGYAGAREEVRVRANRTEGVGITLERSSATLRLVTRPAGAALIVDDEFIGATQAPSEADQRDADGEPSPGESAQLVVDGLLPGWHDIEVSLAGYRPLRQRLEVPDLADYDLGVLELQRSLGVLLVRGLPPGANLLIDGESVGPDRGTMESSNTVDSARLSLTIGTHTLLVDAGRAGVYETSFTIGDDETTAVDVQVRPAIAWLGAIGGDALDRDAVRSAVLPALEAADRWALLDRAGDRQVLLQRAEVTPAALTGQDADAWEAFEGEAREALGAGIFVAAALPPGGPAAYTDLRVWAADDAVPAVTMRVDLGGSEELAAFLTALADPLPAARAWLGAQTMDDPAGGAVVVDVAPGSPAALAGVVFGDRIATFDGAAIAGSSDLSRSVAQAQPFASVLIGIDSASGPREVRAALGSSPYVPRPQGQDRLAPVVWAAAAAEISRGGSTRPAWSLQLLQGMVALRAGAPRRAAETLGRITVQSSAPFGAAAVDYWHAVALLALPAPDLDTAAMVLRRAAQSEHGRLLHNDGPRVAPAARALLDAIGER